MRRSAPMAVATSCTLAPAASHRSATSLMKLIFMARKALAAYLASSAEFPAHEHHRRVAQGKRLVQPLHELLRPLVVAADQHAVRMHEVVDGGAFAQEFRIGADREIGVGTKRLETPLDLAAGADRHRRFGADDGEALEMRRKLLDRLKHEAEIGMAVAAAHRRADGEKHEIGVADRRGEIRGEA